MTNFAFFYFSCLKIGVRTNEKQISVKIRCIRDIFFEKYMTRGELGEASYNFSLVLLQCLLLALYRIVFPVLIL